MNDINVLYHLYHYNFTSLDLQYQNIFFDFPHSRPIINQEIFNLLSELQLQLSWSTSLEEFYKILLTHRIFCDNLPLICILSFIMTPSYFQPNRISNIKKEHPYHLINHRISVNFFRMAFVKCTKTR